MSKIDKNVIEYCKCYINSILTITDCACGLSHLKGSSSNIVHYKGFHWEIMCALQAAAEELDMVYTILNTIALQEGNEE